MGKLYINYPMIESYQHLNALPDPEYIELKVPVSVRPGKKYKALVRNSFLNTAIIHPARMRKMLERTFKIKEEILDGIVEGILQQDKDNDFLSVTEQLLADVVEQKDIKTATYQLKDLVWKTGYVKNGRSYWKYMRELFRQVILINIDKAYRIQYGEDAYKNYKLSSENKYNALDDKRILDKQNEESANEESGYIWVLNTCIMLVAEYNFKLLTE